MAPISSLSNGSFGPKLALSTCILFSSLVLLFLSTTEARFLYAGCNNKVDVGLAYVHLDILESNQTIKELNMPGIRGDATMISDTGWCLKSFALYAKHDGTLFNYGTAVGKCFPFFDIVVITPLSGISYTDLTTSIGVDLGEMGKIKSKETFHAIAPYVGVEVVIGISSKWRLCGTAQYAWSHSKTKIKELLHSKSHSKGPIYALLLEYDLYACCSINLGAAYNASLSEEKHGIRGRGAKVGIAYWF
ncbi:MAG: hypothetical protein WB791_05680 [Waddliaceae bacterium]